MSKLGLLSWRATSCSGCGNGRGFISTPFTMEKIAVLAPMPSAKRHYGYDGEAAALPQHARAEADIAPQHFERGKAAAIAVFFFCLLHAAELDERLPPRFLRIHAGTQVVIDMHLEMGFDLFREFAAALLRAKETGATQQPRTQMSHEDLPKADARIAHPSIGFP